MKERKELFLLTALYPLKRYPNYELDEKIIGLVGRPEMGRGSNLKGKGMRDVGFIFEKEKDAKRALTRLKDKKIEATLGLLP